MEETKIIAIHHNFSHTIFATVEEATVSSPLIIVKEERGTYKNFDYTNQKYNYRFIESNGLKVGRWYAKYDGMGSGNGYNFFYPIFLITDPKGIQKEYRCSKSCIDGIIEVIKHLRDISIYDRWADFELKTENDKLKFKISLLEKEILQLKG